MKIRLQWISRFVYYSQYGKRIIGLLSITTCNPILIAFSSYDTYLFLVYNKTSQHIIKRKLVVIASSSINRKKMNVTRVLLHTSKNAFRIGNCGMKCQTWTRKLLWDFQYVSRVKLYKTFGDRTQLRVEKYLWCLN